MSTICPIHALLTRLATKPGEPSRLCRIQALRNFFFFDGSGLDDAPEGLGDIDSGGPRAVADAAIYYQVDAAVHHAEDIDAAVAGGMAGNISAGGDERLVYHFDELVGDYGARAAQRQAASVASHLQRDFRRCLHDDRERPGPEAPRQQVETVVQLPGQFFGRDGAPDQDGQRTVRLAALGGKNLA